jgi:hypothetical protein
MASSPGTCSMGKERKKERKKKRKKKNKAKVMNVKFVYLVRN